MKLTLKTLNRDSFDVEIDENLTVLDLKKKVEEKKGSGYAFQNLKLIYAGKILTDEKVIKEYDISAFIVVMVSKAKPPNPEQSTSSVAAPTSAATPPTPATPVVTPAAAPAPEPVSTPAAPPVSTPAPPPTTTQPTSVDNMLVSGPEYTAAVAEMEAMGFERSQIERAMTASFMNPHRAIEYLFNPGSMPAVQTAPAPAAAVAAPPAAAAPTEAATTPPAEGATSPAAGIPGVGNLDFLREQPQFQMLRRMIEQNPQMLQSVLQELGQANPQLLQAIQNNPQQFISLLQESGGGATGGGGGGDAPATPQAPPSGGVTVTPAEKAAIERIKDLGFPEHLVVQAYFACEKNENLAAEFLLSENFQDDNP